METSIQLIVSKIEELIIASGGKIQAFYPYVVKQQMIIGATWLVGIVLTVIFASLGIRWVVWGKWDCDEPADAKTVIGIVFCFLAVVGMLVVLISCTEGLGRLINPHYWAVQAIFDMGGKLIK